MKKFLLFFLLISSTVKANTLENKYDKFLKEFVSLVKYGNNDKGISILKDTVSFDTYEKMINKSYNKNVFCKDNVDCANALLVMYFSFISSTLNTIEKKQKEKGNVFDRTNEMNKLRKKVSFDSFYEGFSQCLMKIKSKEEITPCIMSEIIKK